MWKGWGFEGGIDDYTTLRSLKRYVALLNHPNGKPLHRYNEELAKSLHEEVNGLVSTMRACGVFSSRTDQSSIKKNVELMKRVRDELGDVFLYSFCVANILNMDVSKTICDKLRQQEREMTNALQNKRK